MIHIDHQQQIQTETYFINSDLILTKLLQNEKDKNLH